MQEIKCPKCGAVIQVDETSYNKIVQQVRDNEFLKEVDRREKELSKQNESKYELLSLKKDNEMNLKQEKILELQAKLETGEMNKKLAISEALKQKEEEISKSINEIEHLKMELKNKEIENKSEKDSIKANYEQQLKDKDNSIEYYKSYKLSLSTKMIGESLEQHCLTEFNSIRMTAFPKAEFEKDNDIKNGTKGDFIYRECDESGIEFISIMFEMKNEEDKTATKHKNEDFFKKLDKDRNEKKCEYAILVSLLESENELYNRGIVDVSYEFPKMYVIRPQFFIAIISLLRNAAKNSLKYLKELQLAHEQELDISNFEKKMNEFKQGFSNNCRLASEKFSNAITEIDKTINHLQKIKEALLSSENNLRLANNKADDLSIKRLTKDSPSVRAMFQDMNK